MNWFNRYADPVYSILRIVVGLLFACHGATKVLGFPASQYLLKRKSPALPV